MGSKCMEDPPSRPRRQEGVIVQEAQGQTVLLRLEDGSYYALDDVGARVWELCDGERTTDEIVEGMCAEFAAPRETIAADVLDFVSELREERLLVEAA